jgi:hypothetical protein
VTFRTYSTGGKAQMMLAHLTEGPATCSDLCHATAPRNDKERSKAHRVVQALKEDVLIERRAGGYVITDQGEAALKRLSAGDDVTIGSALPNVRIFAPRAAV